MILKDQQKTVPNTFCQLIVHTYPFILQEFCFLKVLESSTCLLLNLGTSSGYYSYTDTD